MPIGIRYDVPQAIGPASFIGGLGQYQSRQQAMALQAAQLGLQDQHFQQNLAAQLYQQEQNRVAHQQSQMFDASRQFGLLNQQRQANREDMSLRRDWQTADQLQQRDWHVADSATNFANSKALADAGRNFQAEQWQKQQAALWQRQGIESTEQAIDGQIKQVANNMDLVQPGDMDEFKKHYNNWNAIRSNRAIQSDPAAYGEALQTFANNFAKSGVIARMKPRLNTAEQFKEETFSQPGIGIVGRDRNGAWRQIAPEPDPIGDFVNKNLKNYQNPESGEVDFDRAMVDAEKYVQAREQLRARQQSVGATGTNAPPGSQPAQQPPIAPSNPPPFDPPPMMAPPQRMPTTPVSQPPRAAQQQYTPEQQWLLSQGADPRVVARVTPDKIKAVMAMQGANAPDPQILKSAAFLEGVKVAHEDQAKEDAIPKPIKVTSMPQKLQHIYPRPKSKDEFEAIPKGTQFVAPDGTLWTK